MDKNISKVSTEKEYTSVAKENEEPKPKPKVTNVTIEQMKEAIKDAIDLESMENGIIDVIVDYVRDITEIFNFKDEKDPIVLSGKCHDVEVIFCFKPYHRWPYNGCDIKFKADRSTTWIYQQQLHMEYKKSFDEIGFKDDAKFIWLMPKIREKFTSVCGLCIGSFPVSMFEDMLYNEDCNGIGEWLQCKKGKENEGIKWIVKRCPGFAFKPPRVVY